MLALLHLEEVVVLIFDLTIAICFVLDELALVQTLVGEMHLSAADSLVIAPFAFVPFAVWVDHDTLSMSPMIAVSAIVVRSILEHDLDASMRSSTVLKSAFYDLIRSRVEDALSVWVVLAPVAAVDGAARKLADTSAVSLIVLETSFVNVTIQETEGTLSISFIL